MLQLFAAPAWRDSGGGSGSGLAQSSRAEEQANEREPIGQLRDVANWLEFLGIHRRQANQLPWEWNSVRKRMNDEDLVIWAARFGAIAILAGAVTLVSIGTYLIRNETTRRDAEKKRLAKIESERKDMLLQEARHSAAAANNRAEAIEGTIERERIAAAPRRFPVDKKDDFLKIVKEGLTENVTMSVSFLTRETLI